MLGWMIITLRNRYSNGRASIGQTLVEYGLLIALIAVIAIAALLFLGPVVANLFNNIGTGLEGQ